MRGYERGGNAHAIDFQLVTGYGRAAARVPPPDPLLGL
jgi:hypothetical protein